METLVEKFRIIEGSNTHGSVDLDSLTNLPQVIMPPKFKAPEFIKYDGIGDLCAHLRMFCRNVAPYGDNQEILAFYPFFLKKFGNMPLFPNYIGVCPCFETRFYQNRVMPDQT